MKRLIVSILFLSLFALTAQAGPNQVGAGQGQRGGLERMDRIHDSTGIPANRGVQADRDRQTARSRQQIHEPGTGDPAVQTRSRRSERTAGKGNAGDPGTGNGNGNGETPNKGNSTGSANQGDKPDRG